jgi:ribosomal-protein-alanine N-acetyltransferase
MVLLNTERLTLRELEAADWMALHAVESDPEVARYQDFGPRTAEESRDYLARAVRFAAAEPRRSFDLAVVLRAEQRFIGRCGFGMSDEDGRQGMLWYTLHRDYWGRGYTTEAARALVTFGFQQVRLHRVWADCDPANIGSVRVLEKLGMRREGHLRENLWIQGGWADSYIYAILDREWPRLP